MTPKAEQDQLKAELLTKVMVGALLGGVSTRHIENLVRRGRMPEPTYIDRHPRWSRVALTDWISAGCPIVNTDKFRQWQVSNELND